MSHPVWVRGLKPVCVNAFGVNSESHPVWVRGLKLFILNIVFKFVKSHPVWVRGLKHDVGRGTQLRREVAPRVGAWIETRTS